MTAAQKTFPRVAAPDNASEESQERLHRLEIEQRNIRRYIAEIAELSQSNCEPDAFFDGFMQRVMSALSSVGGAVWLIDDENRLQLKHQTNFEMVGVHSTEANRNRHTQLLQRVVESAEPAFFLPQSAMTDTGDAGNPTDCALAVGVIGGADQVRGVVEVFQPPGGTATTHRGYTRFLVSMCELAVDFLRNRELQQFQNRQQLWSRLEEFIASVHGSLEVARTSAVIVNESRRLIDCDRVTLAATHAGGCRVAAVSGIDTIDHRSDQVKRLTTLSRAVLRAGEPLWCEGETTNLPPQIETALHQYLDSSHAAAIAVLPLSRTADEGASYAPEKLGALVVEYMHETPDGAAWRKRAEAAAQHGGAALANAVEHNRIFLMPVWKLLGKLQTLFYLRNLPKTLLAMLAVAAIVAAMVLVPYDFSVSSSGVLRPVLRDDVFAEQGGKIIDVAVRTDQVIEKNDVLLRLESSDLKIDVVRLQGRLAAAEEQILGIERDLALGSRLSLQQQEEREDELLQLREAAENYRHELALFQQQSVRMTVRSPRRGQVVTWKVRHHLANRTVEKGQRLLTIADPDGGWEIELDVPEKRMCHLTPAFRQARAEGEELKATFMLATHPGREFEGTVVHISPVAEVRGDVGNAVRVRVAIEADDLPELRDGSKVSARIHCGERAVGYVIFHDLIETVWSKVLFWI